MTSKRPLVVELIGPPGAGKSTVSRLLCAQERRVRPALGIWGLPRPLLARHAVRLLPELLATPGSTRAASLEIALQRIRLSAFHPFLVREARAPHRVIQMDEGPIFALVWLRMFHPGALEASPLRRWWEREVARWSEAVDAVVLLDAPDRVLTERIRTRSKPHPVKDGTDGEILDFIAGFRAAFAQLAADLVTPTGGPTILSVSTAREGAEQVARRILKALNQECHVG